MLIPLASLLFAQAVTAQAAPPACTGENYAALDFWVGEWDVYRTGRETLVAHSRIEKLYNGCAIRENWMPLSGNAGGSLSGYDPVSRRWHQTWIGSAPGPAPGPSMRDVATMRRHEDKDPAAARPWG